MSRRFPFALAAVLLLLPLMTARPRRRRASARPDLQAHVVALTAPAMEGRGSGPPGGDRAARYIAGVLPRAGLRPAGDAGSFRP